jgi:ABC-2 type transport system permease protein
MKIKRINALMKKELIRVIREPANLFMVLIFPLILTLSFGVAFGALGSGGDIQYRVGIVDDDASDWSKWFQSNITKTRVLSIVGYEDQNSAYKDLQTGGVSAVLVVPESFSASIEGFLADPGSSSWQRSTLELALDQGSMIVGSVVPQFIQQALTLTIYGEASLSQPSPVIIGKPTLVNSVKLTQFDYLVPGVFSFGAIFISLIVAQVLTEERNTGILARISTTPTTASEIFTSMICANLVTGVVQVLIILGSSILMGFRPQTGLTGIIVAMVATLLLVVVNVGFGLIVASISKTSSSATGIGFIFILPQMFLGSFVPAPESVSRLAPTFYVTETLKNLFLRGAEAGSMAVQFNILILVLYALTVASLGVYIFNRLGKK